jgi:GAF domain-containing protein
MNVSVHDVRHALNELGKLRFGEMRVEDAMHHIVQTTHAIFSVDGAGLMLADVDHHLLNAAVSDDRMKHLEELQIRHQEGPCIAAFEDKELVRAEDLTAEMRWPDFSKHAVARGVRAVLASPIPYNQDAVGVVAVMSEDRRPWSAEAELALLAFTDLAALLIATMMMGEQQTELAAQLQAALNSRAIIEQAKGVLIGQQGITAHAAYAQLRAQARAERRKLAVVSAELVRRSVRADLAPAPPAGADAGLMQGQQGQPDQQQVGDVEPGIGGGAGAVDDPGDSEDDRRDDSKHALAASLAPPRYSGRRHAGLSRFVLRGLEGEKLGVLAAEREQFAVPALLDHPPVTQHVDPVRVPDAGEPVGDQHHAAVLRVPANRAEQRVLGAGIQGCGRLVHDQQRR